ncbi:hypothetical protein F5I97DRAFT_370435 [Phlebopus sp. FC_14]|nr:hypothetical protein F5I97DRAFT_370435 [Phlebopus sp. FC_14]
MRVTALFLIVTLFSIVGSLAASFGSDALLGETPGECLEEGQVCATIVGSDKPAVLDWPVYPGKWVRRTTPLVKKKPHHRQLDNVHKSLPDYRYHSLLCCDVRVGCHITKVLILSWLELPHHFKASSPPSRSSSSEIVQPIFGSNAALMILGWIPGILHAWYIISRSEGAM